MAALTLLHASFAATLAWLLTRRAWLHAYTYMDGSVYITDVVQLVPILA
jgi:hypothetical protein